MLRMVDVEFIKLRAHDGWSIRETARRTGWSRQAIRKALAAPAAAPRYERRSRKPSRTSARQRPAPKTPNCAASRDAPCWRPGALPSTPRSGTLRALPNRWRSCAGEGAVGAQASVVL